MQVKIGDQVFSDETLPIMITLSESDRKNLANMPSEATKYASAPDNYFPTPEAFRKWMDHPDHPELPDHPDHHPV